MICVFFINYCPHFSMLFLAFLNDFSPLNFESKSLKGELIDHTVHLGNFCLISELPVTYDNICLLQNVSRRLNLNNFLLDYISNYFFSVGEFLPVIASLTANTQAFVWNKAKLTGYVQIIPGTFKLMFFEIKLKFASFVLVFRKTRFNTKHSPIKEWNLIEISVECCRITKNKKNISDWTYFLRCKIVRGSERTAQIKCTRWKAKESWKIGTPLATTLTVRVSSDTNVIPTTLPIVLDRDKHRSVGTLQNIGLC